MTKRTVLPFDSDHLTPVEQEVEDSIDHKDCWHCTFLVCHETGGYRGCEKGHETYPVMSGQKDCIDWVKK